jgi:dTDP-4-amino-4,6-dideoxygalactose transaminase
MKIPFYNFESLHHAQFQKQVGARFTEILKTNSFVEGKYNLQFENDFSLMQKSQYCLLVANGTDALEISLKASGVQPGDFVGLPGITFFATAEAIINVGARPIFIDIDSETGLICPESFSRVSSKYSLKAVIPVHIYGLPAPIDKIEQIAKNKKIAIIEDAAQAFGSFFDAENQKPVGSTNNLATFSFYPTKNLSAMGDAGAILTQNEEIMRRIKALRNHGRGSESLVGRNSRCDHLQAAVIHLKLQEAQSFNQKRKDVAQYYFKYLKFLNDSLLPEKYLPLSSWHLFPIRIRSNEVRKRLQRFLTDSEIGCAPYYEKSMSQEKALAEFEGETKKAEDLAGRILCLPINPFISEKEVKFICSQIKNFFYVTKNERTLTN